MPSLSIIDLEAIENLRSLSPGDNDVFLKEVISIYLQDTPLRISDLHTNRASGDSEGFVRAAHSIKGSSSNVGAAEVRTHAEQLEHFARTHGVGGSHEMIASIEAAFNRAQAAFHQLL